MRFIALTLIFVTFTSTVAAQSPKAAAESLYNDGRQLMTDGKYAEACAKFEASQRLDPASGTQLNLAHCLEKLGKTASAWAEYKEAAATARAAVEASRQEIAEKGASALEPGLSKVRITAEPTPGLEVHLDGVTLSAGVLNSDLPVDPGAHTVEAAAAGRVSYTASITLAANGDKKTVAIPALAIQPGAPTPIHPGEDTKSPQRTVGIVLGAAGVVGVVIGTVFGANALSKNSSAKPHCGGDPTVCDPDGDALVHSAKTAATVSTVSFIAGGAALMGGSILFFTARPSARPKSDGATLDVHPVVGSTTGLMLHGNW